MPLNFLFRPLLRDSRAWLARNRMMTPSSYLARGTNAAARAAIGTTEPTPSAPVAAPLSSTLGTKPQP